MKKLLSIMLALVVVLGMSSVSFADVDTNTDMSTVTITKDYQVTNAGTTSPAETFTFTIDKVSVTDAADGVTVANMPVPTIGSVSYAQGNAGDPEKMSQNITVNMPTYPSVGIYTYVIKEKAGQYAGVTYYGNDIRLVVTVQQGEDGHIRVAAVHTEAAGGAKADNFPNIYSAGTLEVEKVVTGNLGDRDKAFTVDVTFKAPDGKVVAAPINYTDDGVDKAITGTWSGKKTATITLKHGEKVNFTNIPYGVIYTVAEHDYTADGYDAAVYEFTDTATVKKIDSVSDKATITNNKGVDVDTGISFDNLPYILLVAGAAIGLGAFIVRRRFAKED